MLSSHSKIENINWHFTVLYSDSDSDSDSDTGGYQGYYQGGRGGGGPPDRAHGHPLWHWHWHQHRHQHWVCLQELDYEILGYQGDRVERGGIELAVGLEGDALGGAAEGLEPGHFHQLFPPHICDVHNGQRLFCRTQQLILRLMVPVTYLLKVQVLDARGSLEEMQLCLINTVVKHLQHNEYEIGHQHLHWHWHLHWPH